MRGAANETVGQNFSVDLLKRARDKTLLVINEVAALMKPGLTEKEAKKLIQEVQAKHGGAKAWHPPQIRFGENTLLAFGQVAKESVPLKDNDIFFFDIGPIFDEHEGDVGRPFAIGENALMKKCCVDAEKIWCAVRDRWSQTGDSGAELYKFAAAEACNLGWELSLHKANGHRIADFPHAARHRGSVEEFATKPLPNRWILEIQIRHLSEPFGAFYEDLLT